MSMLLLLLLLLLPESPILSHTKIRSLPRRLLRSSSLLGLEGLLRLLWLPGRGHYGGREEVYIYEAREGESIIYPVIVGFA